MAKTGKKPNGGNGKKDDFAQWLAKLIDDAHVRTERVIQEVIHEEGAANRALMGRFAEILVGFQEQSERHHRENVEQLRRMDKFAREHNLRLEKILERLSKPGEN